MNTVLAPSPVSAPWVWSADELTSREDWIIRVSDDALREIDNALAAVKQRGLPLTKITAADFPLPTLERKLLKVKELLAQGPGVALPSCAGGSVAPWHSRRTGMAGIQQSRTVHLRISTASLYQHGISVSAGCISVSEVMRVMMSAWQP